MSPMAFRANAGIIIFFLSRAANNIFRSGNLGNWKVFCEMKVLFTIGYIQYAIGLQLYLLKKYIDKVTEGFQAINVSGDVEK